MKNKLLKKKNLIIITIAILLTTSISYLYKSYLGKSSPVVASTNTTLDEYTLEQVSQFDGTDPNKPIYLIYEGYVYDISSGREFYDVNGSYHYLAGTDATSELKIFGGDIIKKKYPIIGIAN